MLAANGTLSQISHLPSLVYPLELGKIITFPRIPPRKTLFKKQLVKEPLLIITPEYKFPLLSREFITEYEIEEESHIAIDDMASPPIRNT